MIISDKRVATLKNALGVTLKNYCNIVQLKHYIQETDNKTKSTSNKKSANFCNHAPNKIVEMIYAVQQSENYLSGHKWNQIKLDCGKWTRTIEGKYWYVETSWKPCNGKIIVSTRKLTSIFGKSTGLVSKLSNCIGDKKWRSSWLILTPGKYSWYTTDWISWKTKMCQPNESSYKLRRHGSRITVWAYRGR